MTCTELNSMTVKELKAICKAMGINSSSVNGMRLNKAGLVSHILNNTEKETTEMTSRNTNWTQDAVEYVRGYQRQHPYNFCPLPELYRAINSNRPLTIGTFHDGLRELVESRMLRLHPFTGSPSELVDEQYALLAAKEIKYYTEFVG